VDKIGIVAASIGKESRSLGWLVFQSGMIQLFDLYQPLRAHGVPPLILLRPTALGVITTTSLTAGGGSLVQAIVNQDQIEVVEAK